MYERIASSHEYSRMPLHSCCEVRVMQLHDILLLRTSAILPESISAVGLTPTTDTSLFLTTYKGGSHLPADIGLFSYFQTILKIFLNFYCILLQHHVTLRLHQISGMIFSLCFSAHRNP